MITLLRWKCIFEVLQVIKIWRNGLNECDCKPLAHQLAFLLPDHLDIFMDIFLKHSSLSPQCDR